MNIGRLLAETGNDTDQLRVLIHPVQPQNLRLRTASPLVRRLWGTGIQAMTLGNLILVDPAALEGDREALARLAIHELVHVRQWRDLGFVRFSMGYMADYLGGRRKGLSHRDAYLQIDFEEEARSVQQRVM